MLFKQFFEPDTCTYTYLLGCEETKQAVLIDPVESELDKYLTELKSMQLSLVYTLETHVHADHVTAANSLRKATGSKSVVHRDAGAVCGDLLVSDGEHINVGSMDIEVRHTPGHTVGCVSYYIGYRIFTGDALLIDGCGRTDFQNGNAAQLYDSIHNKIFTLPDDTLVYPGHDYRGNFVSTVAEEKATNARLGNNKSKAEFVEIMRNLKLDYPKYMDVAVPANQACGNVEN